MFSNDKNINILIMMVNPWCMMKEWGDFNHNVKVAKYHQQYNCQSQSRLVEEAVFGFDKFCKLSLFVWDVLVLYSIFLTGIKRLVQLAARVFILERHPAVTGAGSVVTSHYGQIHLLQSCSLQSCRTAEILIKYSGKCFSWFLTSFTERET